MMKELFTFNFGSQLPKEKRLIFDGPNTPKSVDAPPTPVRAPNGAEIINADEAAEQAGEAAMDTADDASKREAASAAKPEAVAEAEGVQEELKALTTTVDSGKVDQSSDVEFKQRADKRAQLREKINEAYKPALEKLQSAQKDIKEAGRKVSPERKKELQDAYNKARVEVEKIKNDMQTINREELDDKLDQRPVPKTDAEGHKQDMEAAVEGAKNAKSPLEKIVYLAMALQSMIAMINKVPHDRVGKEQELVGKRNRRDKLEGEIKGAGNPGGSVDSLVTIKEGLIGTKEAALDVPDPNLTKAQTDAITAETAYNAALSKATAAAPNTAEITLTKSNLDAVKKKLDQELQRVTKVKEASQKEIDGLKKDVTELKEWKEEVVDRAKTSNEQIKKMIETGGGKLDALKGVSLAVAKDGISLEWQVEKGSEKTIADALGIDVSKIVDGKVVEQKEFSDAIKKLGEGLVEKAGE
ncbi:hypothetical protein KJ652_05685 [Patescibacteria group bacterium]|nr:hypothetical protein [Patescibacteria group bacterium]MBU1124053.1 hypothetical protein [Patescibacteria group bacterium]MBU1911023.1 hypothetical protein [Patescibacteria group bacterium]